MRFIFSLVCAMFPLVRAVYAFLACHIYFSIVCTMLPYDYSWSN